MRFLPKTRPAKPVGSAEEDLVAPRGRRTGRPSFSLACAIQYFTPSAAAIFCRCLPQIPSAFVTLGKGQPPENRGGALAGLRAIALVAGDAEPLTIALRAPRRCCAGQGLKERPAQLEPKPRDEEDEAAPHMRDMCACMARRKEISCGSIISTVCVCVCVPDQLHVCSRVPWTRRDICRHRHVVVRHRASFPQHAGSWQILEVGVAKVRESKFKAAVAGKS